MFQACKLVEQTVEFLDESRKKERVSTCTCIQVNEKSFDLKEEYRDSIKRRETRPGWMHVAMVMTFEP